MTQNTKTVFPHATDIEKVFLIVIQFDYFDHFVSPSQTNNFPQVFLS